MACLDNVTFLGLSSTWRCLCMVFLLNLSCLLPLTLSLRYCRMSSSVIGKALVIILQEIFKVLPAVKQA